MIALWLPDAVIAERAARQQQKIARLQPGTPVVLTNDRVLPSFVGDDRTGVVVACPWNDDPGSGCLAVDLVGAGEVVVSLDDVEPEDRP